MFCQGSVESTFAGKPNEKALGIEFEETEAKMLWKEGAEIWSSGNGSFEESMVICMLFLICEEVLFFVHFDKTLVGIQLNSLKILSSAFAS